MVRTVTSIFLLSFFALSSCNQTSATAKPIVGPNEILKSFMSFLTYRQNHLRLSQDFKALDEFSVEISKENFLKNLSAGNYLPLRLISKDSLASYQLYKLSTSTNSDTRQTLKQWGEHLLRYYQLEGKQLPAFNFEDLKGNFYNKENTKGKILVLKCWFIGCVPCVKEMPALNELKKGYANRDDILFISLAFDPKENLIAFLKNTKFDYEVVPSQKRYLEETVKIDTYPTHIIINKRGLITKVVNDYEEVIVALDKQASQ